MNTYVAALGYAICVTAVFALLDWITGDWTHTLVTVFIVAALGYWNGTRYAGFFSRWSRGSDDL